MSLCSFANLGNTELPAPLPWSFMLAPGSAQRHLIIRWLVASNTENASPVGKSSQGTDRHNSMWRGNNKGH